MFLPIGDSPNPPGRPIVTWALILLNVAAYVWLLPLSFRQADPQDPAFAAYLQAIADDRRLSLPEVHMVARGMSEYDLLVFRHGFHPATPTLAGLLTSMFLHGGFMHLFGNMLFLWIYGDNVEYRMGRILYLMAYLGTGAVAGLGDALIRMGSNLPEVGASGAISGVLGLYFVWFPYNRVRTWVFLFPLFVNVIELPARLVLGVFVLIDNLLPLVLGAEGGVSHGAHIGGFVAGAGLALATGRLSLRGTVPAGRGEADEPASPAGEAAAARRVSPMRPLGGSGLRDALDDGRWEEAARAFFDAPSSRTRTVGPWEKIRLGDALSEHGHPRPALAAYQRALVDHPSGPGRAAAHLGAARVLMDALDNPTGAYQHLYGALEERPDEAEEAEARALLDRLRGVMRHVPGRRPI
ncbi:MAG TPA: rhomboid family intramembrane serine protease [Candidatus Polarisedimenticolia bacterium]|nr:rhomboid family intramembrane serine protease [Candidatus Polarisedimenticolia bacterium]